MAIKSALCIGINDYPGTDMDLQGCVNDANDWSALLTGRGFSVEELLNERATKNAMRDAFNRTIAHAGDGDLVVITFSGHGSYELDLDGDEVKGLDQALCPHDIQTAGESLTDDEIHKLFEARKDGVRIVLIADSCHSGSVNRDVAPAAPGLPRKRFLPMRKWMPAARLARTAELPPQANTPASENFGNSPTQVLGDLLLSGCDDGETDFSYDAVIAGRPNGAFTFYALKALKRLPEDATYDAWHQEIVATLPTVSYPQRPQLVASAAVRQRPLLT